MSSPASLTSDAMLAIDLDTGKLNWSFQATANDVWNTACDTTTPQNCPIENGPDFDFGGATIIVDTTKHGRLVIAGQKSGFVHALNPKDGSLIWQTRVGRGGIQGGIHFGIHKIQGGCFSLSGHGWRLSSRRPWTSSGPGRSARPWRGRRGRPSLAARRRRGVGATAP